MSAEEDHGALTSIIEFLGLEGDEASEFLKVGMTRRGHKPVMSWADGDGKDKSDKGGTVMGIRSGGQKKAAGAGWQYAS